MKKRILSRAEWGVFISMIVIALLAMTASITLAAMTDSDYGGNTVVIASVGTTTAYVSAPAGLYPGGTVDTTLNFQLSKDTHEVSKAKLSAFKLTSMVINYGESKSQTFSTKITNNTSTGTATVDTAAGTWTFALNIGDGLLTAGTAKATNLSITAPLGAPSGALGSPMSGYLVDSVTSVVCTFEMTVEPTEY